jgi:NAD(P)H-hydrate epimerase
MVTIGVPESLADIFQSRATEEMILPLSDTGSGILSEKAYPEIADFLNRRGDVLAVGPGLTSDTHISKLMERLLTTITVPAVLDADALNALSGKRAIFRKAKAPLVLTPHPGEMARLIREAEGKARGAKGSDPDLRAEVEQDRINSARSFAEGTGTYLVLKGVPTVISEPEGRTFLNTTGNPGMATAGSGDVLTGVIAAFLGQGLNPLDAALLGVYLHGLSGDIAASKKGTYSLIASDIIDHMPDAFLSLQ